MAFGILTFFAIVQPSPGTLTKGIADFLGGLFGSAGRVAILVPCFGVGLWLFIRHFNENPLVIQMHRTAGYVLLFLAVITTAHFVVMLNNPVRNMGELIQRSDVISRIQPNPFNTGPLGNGGGWLGGMVYKLLIQIAGEWGVPVILIGIWIVSLMLASSLTIADITAYIKSVFHWFDRVRKSFTDQRQATEATKATSAPLTIEKPGSGASPAAAALNAPLPHRRGKGLTRWVASTPPDSSNCNRWSIRCCNG